MGAIGAALAAAVPPAPARATTGPPVTSGTSAATAPSAPAGALLSSSFASAAAAVEAAVPHDTVVVDRSETVRKSIVVDKPLTMFFTEGVVLTMATDVSAIVVTADDVTISGATLVGAGSSTTGKARGVEVVATVATVATPVLGLRVTGCSISRFSYGAVYLEHVHDFVVDGNEMSDLAYAGVMLFSCLDGEVCRNTVTGVHQSGTFPNSYGIAANRYWNQTVDEAPRSRRIRIADNVVADVPKWEGIDTHGGQDVTIVGNEVTGCAVGIAVVPCRGTDGPATYAPLDCVVASNHVDAAGLAAPRNGIVVKGAGEGPNPPVEAATGALVDNVVKGYGGGTLDAAICLYYTSGLVVARSTLDDSVARAVNVYLYNDDLVIVDTVVSGLTNTVAQRPSVIDVRHADNTAMIVRTRYVPTAGSRPDVLGVYAAVGGNTIDLVANDWSSTTQAVYSVAGNAVTRTREAA